MRKKLTTTKITVFRANINETKNIEVKIKFNKNKRKSGEKSMIIMPGKCFCCFCFVYSFVICSFDNPLGLAFISVVYLLNLNIEI
jgi:hypothetical protein